MVAPPGGPETGFDEHYVQPVTVGNEKKFQNKFRRRSGSWKIRLYSDHVPQRGIIESGWIIKFQRNRRDF